ncbi:hypothetical protein [Nocardioides caricicola]|uniref:DUF4190 domain-containing protein n=1 Tax=Nocardioides caricicola TaxID=634770 RepID=A0ABW0N2E8_9ACTN
MSNPEQPPYGEQPPQQPHQQQPGGFQQGFQQQFQPPYGQQPPYAYNFTPQPPAHNSATTAMALGLIGLIGLLFCGGLTLILSPFAWAIGGKAVREIDANPGAYSGREQAFAGKVMGIIGTVLLVLGVLAFALFIGWVVTLDSSTLD